MMYRIFLSLLLVSGLATTAMAQADASNPCAELAKRHLATLDAHLDLDYQQMKCLKEKATTFCARNRSNPAQNKQQRETRLATFRKAILACLDADQRIRVVSHYRNERDEQARRNLLQAFLDEFGDEVEVRKKS